VSNSFHVLRHTLVGAALALVVGCSDCDGKGTKPGAAGAPLREQQTEAARLRSRLAARQLDPNKVYAKDDSGQVTCGQDCDCFLAQVSQCSKATLEHKVEMTGFGLTQRVRSRYVIAGKRSNGCLVRRERLSTEVKLDPRWAAMLKQQGKTDEEIEGVRAFTLATLEDQNPMLAYCVLPDDLLLEAVLDLGDKRYDPQFWRDHCSPNDPG